MINDELTQTAPSLQLHKSKSFDKKIKRNSELKNYIDEVYGAKQILPKLNIPSIPKKKTYIK